MKKSRYEDIDEISWIHKDKIKICTDKEHYPPTHLSVPFCPSCGCETSITNTLYNLGK